MRSTRANLPEVFGELLFLLENRDKSARTRSRRHDLGNVQFLQLCTPITTGQTGWAPSETARTQRLDREVRRRRAHRIHSYIRYIPFSMFLVSDLDRLFCHP
jgi:hypothetical protein